MKHILPGNIQVYYILNYLMMNPYLTAKSILCVPYSHLLLGYAPVQRKMESLPQKGNKIITNNNKYVYFCMSLC